MGTDRSLPGMCVRDRQTLATLLLGAISLSNGDGSLTFEVTEDGRGSDRSALTYGTGLQGIEDRPVALDGTRAVRSAPGRGTTITGNPTTATVEGLS